MSIVARLCHIVVPLLLLVVFHQSVSAQWQRLQTDTTYSVEYFFANEDAVLIEPFDVLRYFSDEAKIWKLATVNNPYRIFRIIQRENDLLGILYGQGKDSLLHSTDGGKSWNKAGEQPFGSRFRAIMEDGTLSFAVGIDIKRIVKSEGIWQDFGSQPRNVGSYESICHDNKYYYLGTTDGGVMRSGDSAKIWSFDTIGTGKRNIGQLLTAGGVVFGSFFAGGVFRSTNHGDNWVRNTTYLPDSIKVARFYRYGWVVFASTNRGLYRTIDGGETWDLLNSGFPENEKPDVRGVGVHRGYLYAGLLDHDVWRMPLRDAFAPASIIDLDSSYVGIARDSLFPTIVSNTASDTIFVTGVVTQEEDALDFSVIGALDTLALAPGASFSLRVRFSPLKSGNRHTTLAITTVDKVGEQTLHRFLLIGQGLPIPYEVVTSAVDFGTVQVGNSKVQTVVALRVTGSQQLMIDSVTIVGANTSAFAVTSGGGDTLLATGNELALGVAFQPDIPDTLQSDLLVWGRGTVLAGISLRGIGHEGPMSVPGIRSGISGLEVAPSPVVGRASIRYVAATSGTVTIGLYNLQSQCVWSVEGGIVDAGEQLWTMDVHDLPDGVYIVRVVANGSVFIRKVVVAR